MIADHITQAHPPHPPGSACQCGAILVPDDVRGTVRTALASECPSPALRNTKKVRNEEEEGRERVEWGRHLPCQLARGRTADATGCTCDDGYAAGMYDGVKLAVDRRDEGLDTEWGGRERTQG